MESTRFTTETYYSTKPENIGEFWKIEERKVVGYDCDSSHSEYEGWDEYYHVSCPANPVTIYILHRMDMKQIRESGKMADFIDAKRQLDVSNQVFSPHFA